MKRYEDIGNFWNERGAGKAEAEIMKRAEALMIVEARRYNSARRTNTALAPALRSFRRAGKG